MQPIARKVRIKYPFPRNTEPADVHLAGAAACSGLCVPIRDFARAPRYVKLAVAYVALALGLSTFTELLVQTLCARTHKPSSGDVQTMKLTYNVDPGKRHQHCAD